MSAAAGEAVYTGRFAGYGQVLDVNGDLLGSEISVRGEITLTVNFDDANTVDGVLMGGEDSFDDFEMTFSSGIAGNGYGADLAYASGSTNNVSVIGGVLYGANALETSGVIGLDINTTVQDPEDDDATVDACFLASAGFTATQGDDEPARE